MNLKEEVIKEAHSLREHATEKELAKLDFGTMSPLKTEKCIYGQMSGDCKSERAIELLRRCAVPYSDEVDFQSTPSSGFYPYSVFRSFSAIECYICRQDSGNETLISFLRGERETLTIEDL